jgi:tetratricopeptide (TPR) repeat protein
MSKFKLYKIATLVLVFIFGGYYYLRPQNKLDYEEHIEKYTALLSQEPKNCHYLSQLANSYQAINNFDKSIYFYKKVFEFCPDDLLSVFQLGVSHFMIMERDKAIKYMDQAIERAKKRSDKKLEEMFIDSKKAWLDKWDEIKTMKWNKGKMEKTKTR